jgi:hypothetical protein
MNAKQMILVGVGVAVLCAGIGIAVTSFGTTSTPSVNGTEPDGPPPPLEFPDKQTVHYQEAYTAGHYTFRFKSKVDTATKVGINWKNCKCASVEMAIAPPEWGSYEDSTLIKMAHDPHLEWTSLSKDDEGFSIPARANGWVRVGWKDDKVGDQRFTAEMWVYQPNSGILFTLDIGVSFLEPISICWEDEQQKADASVGKLSPGDQREAQFLIWSCTRKEFTIQELPRKDDACITAGAPTPLSDQDLQFLTIQHKRKALSGYRVVVTVKERSGEQQLDIGPFRRGISWKAEGLAIPVRGTVGGTVLGEVSASLPGNRETLRLDMGDIDPKIPLVHQILLESDNPQVELIPDDKTLDLLKVEIAEGSRGKDVTLNDGSMRRKWTVNVSFRPDSGFRGPFPKADSAGYTPTDCVVAFKIAHTGVKEDRLRRIRIPVSGQVRN